MLQAPCTLDTTSSEANSFSIRHVTIHVIMRYGVLKQENTLCDQNMVQGEQLVIYSSADTCMRQIYTEMCFIKIFSVKSRQTMS